MVTPISRDLAGQTLEPDATVPQVVTASRAPVIALAYANLNRGLLAMTANTGRSHGRLMAAHALRLLDGASPASVAIEVDGNSPLAFDARQLERWGIDEALLPASAQVEHRRAAVLLPGQSRLSSGPPSDSSPCSRRSSAASS